MIAALNNGMHLLAALAALVTYALTTEERILYAFIALIAAYAILASYMLPIYVADHRKHPQTKPIMVLTIIGGWSGLLWIIALVWAFYSFDE